jgi:hypothetical protein
MTRQLSFIDHLVIGIDRMRRSATGEAPTPARASPATEHPDAALAEAARQHAAGLMRINHTGEVCAQALYQGQALTDPGAIEEALWTSRAGIWAAPADLSPAATLVLDNYFRGREAQSVIVNSCCAS